MSNEQKSSQYVFNSQLRWQHDNSVVKNQSVRIIRADNTEIQTMTDSEGRLPAQFSQFVEPIQIIIDAKNKK